MSLGPPSYGLGVFGAEVADAPCSGVFAAAAGAGFATGAGSGTAGCIRFGASESALLVLLEPFGLILNPLGPVNDPLSFGSIPNNDPFFMFSTAGIRGTSSRFTGLTT